MLVGSEVLHRYSWQHVLQRGALLGWWNMGEAGGWWGVGTAIRVLDGMGAAVRRLQHCSVQFISSQFLLLSVVARSAKVIHVTSDFWVLRGH